MMYVLWIKSYLYQAFKFDYFVLEVQSLSLQADGLVNNAEPIFEVICTLTTYCRLLFPSRTCKDSLGRHTGLATTEN